MTGKSVNLVRVVEITADLRYYGFEFSENR